VCAPGFVLMLYFSRLFLFLGGSATQPLRGLQVLDEAERSLANKKTILHAVSSDYVFA
jgi:hypothetical protein